MEDADKSSYVYTWTRPDTGDVFYVGLGTGYRDVTIKTHNAVFMRIVNKLKKSGLSPTVQRIAENLSLAEAKALEISEIARIGRKHLGTGPLANLNAGGDGSLDPSAETRKAMGAAWLGKSHSEETRSKISAANRGKKRSPETCARIGDAKRGMVHSAESRAKMSAALRGRVICSETRSKMSVAQSNRSPETCAKISDALKGKPKSAEHRAKITGIPKTAAHRAKLSAAKMGKTPDQDTRNKLCSGHRMSGPQSNNTSGYKGVSTNRKNGNWIAQIKLNKVKHIGSFSDAKSAALAYDRAAVDAWGFGNCYLNFPEAFFASPVAKDDNDVSRELSHAA